jgi:hypothetical protein
MRNPIQNAFAGRIFDIDWVALNKPSTMSQRHQRRGLGRVPSDKLSDVTKPVLTESLESAAETLDVREKTA